jgi:FkbM family methyltransferase
MATECERAQPSASRRGFFRRVSRYVSGSFILGTAGGATAGAVGMRGHDRRQGLIGQTSYAQQGEDLILWNMCEHLHIDQPTYLDIGAYDPVVISNTYLFYTRGCRGVLVEPNPARWARLESVRPRDTLLRAGIGTSSEPETEADFYVIGSTGGLLGGDDLSTFSREEAEAVTAKTGGRHFVEKVIRMKLLNVNKVMEEHFQGAPNVVSIDVEGLDLDILRTLDFGRFRPDLFCVETVEFGTHEFRPDVVDFLASKDYVFRGGTFVNSIFLDKRRFK